MTEDNPDDVLTSREVESPVGRLTIVASQKGLRAVLWPNEREGRVRIAHEPEAPGAPSSEIIDTTSAQLAEYFDQTRQTFEVPLDLQGTDFQVSVWRALIDIGFGETATYSHLAESIGRPTAARAVGAAVGRNPISIVVPCHRIIGSNGALTGFAGGLETKRFLLGLESPR